MKFLLTVAFILLVKCSEITVSGFTYDDEDYEINKDDYGFDISELRHVTAEQPKYNTIVRGYRGPETPKVKNILAKPGDKCDTAKYKQYLYPIHKVQTDKEYDPTYKRVGKVKILDKKFKEQGEKKEFTWVEVCYHMCNPMYCKDGECACLEVPENGYFGSKLEKEETYDPLSLQYYKSCVIQRNYGCRISNCSTSCDEGLHCSSIGVCREVGGADSVSLSRTLWTVVLTGIYKLFFD